MKKYLFAVLLARKISSINALCPSSDLTGDIKAWDSTRQVGIKIIGYTLKATTDVDNAESFKFDPNSGELLFVSPTSSNWCYLTTEPYFADNSNNYLSISERPYN